MIYVFAVPQFVPGASTEQPDLQGSKEGSEIPETVTTGIQDSNDDDVPQTESSSDFVNGTEDLDHLHEEVSDEEMDAILEDVNKAMERYAEPIEKLNQTHQVDLGVLLGAWKLAFEDRHATDVLDYLNAAIEGAPEDPIDKLAQEVIALLKKEAGDESENFVETYRVAVDQVDDQFRDEVEDMIASDSIDHTGEDVLEDVEGNEELSAMAVDING